jgi:hypothetical protein
MLLRTIHHTSVNRMYACDPFAELNPVPGALRSREGDGVLQR